MTTSTPTASDLYTAAEQAAINGASDAARLAASFGPRPLYTAPAAARPTKSARRAARRSA